jgi:hypothetical protein
VILRHYLNKFNIVNSYKLFAWGTGSFKMKISGNIMQIKNFKKPFYSKILFNDGEEIFIEGEFAAPSRLIPAFNNSPYFKIKKYDDNFIVDIELSRYFKLLTRYVSLFLIFFFLLCIFLFFKNHQIKNYFSLLEVIALLHLEGIFINYFILKRVVSVIKTNLRNDYGISIDLI